MTEPKPATDAPSPADSDDDIAACAPNGTVRSASTCLLVSGFMALIMGLQIVTSLRFNNPMIQGALYVMMAAGAATMYIGVRLYRMSSWAALAATAVATLLTLGMGTWLVFSFKNGLFTLFAPLAPVLALGAAVASYLSIPAVRRATAVRERLQDAGIELGF